MKTFELNHPSGLKISPSLTKEELFASFGNIPDRDMGTGWIWYSLPTFTDDEVVVSISLGFNREKLEALTLSDSHQKYGSGWKDWSETKERRRAEQIGKWLLDKGYPAGTYEWGAVSADFDIKGGFGSASIRLMPFS